MRPLPTVNLMLPLGPGRCRYRTQEDMTGLLAGLVGVLYGADVQRGFETTAAQLKARAEGMAVSYGSGSAGS